VRQWVEGGGKGPRASLTFKGLHTSGPRRAAPLLQRRCLSIPPSDAPRPLAAASPCAQVGATPSGVETPRCLADPACQERMAALAPGHQAAPVTGAGAHAGPRQPAEPEWRPSRPGLRRWIGTARGLVQPAPALPSRLRPLPPLTPRPPLHAPARAPRQTPSGASSGGSGRGRRTANGWSSTLTLWCLRWAAPPPPGAWGLGGGGQRPDALGGGDALRLQRGSGPRRAGALDRGCGATRRQPGTGRGTTGWGATTLPFHPPITLPHPQGPHPASPHHPRPPSPSR
jgi:hypothetical protein